MYWALAAIILLPVLPAFLLFKALPSSAEVTGPFKSLTIKLGGAFAGYFAILLVIFSTHNIWNPPPIYQVWQINGSVTDTQGNAIQPFDPTDIALAPPPLQPLVDGKFTLSFSTWPGQGGGTEYPTLLISHKNFRPVTISLDPSNPPKSPDLASSHMTWDKKHLLISIQNLPLQQLPEYQGASATQLRPSQVHSTGGGH
jgi:phosphotransferase system  glucose/maltose/N-acetylglucosamine-specific IIC component